MLPQYQTPVLCPVCNKQIDVLRHVTQDIHAQSAAMILNDSRRKHATESPECTTKQEWLAGWIYGQTCAINQSANDELKRIREAIATIESKPVIANKYDQAAYTLVKWAKLHIPNADDDPIGWNIIAIDNSSVLCESAHGHRRRYYFGCDK